MSDARSAAWAHYSAVMRKLGIKDQEAREVWIRAERITLSFPAAASIGSLKAGSAADAPEFVGQMMRKVVLVVPRELLLGVLVPLGIGYGVLALTGSPLVGAAAVLVVFIILFKKSIYPAVQELLDQLSREISTISRRDVREAVGARLCPMSRLA